MMSCLHVCLSHGKSFVCSIFIDGFLPAHLKSRSAIRRCVASLVTAEALRHNKACVVGSDAIIQSYIILRHSYLRTHAQATSVPADVMEVLCKNVLEPSPYHELKAASEAMLADVQRLLILLESAGMSVSGRDDVIISCANALLWACTISFIITHHTCR